jgi:D-alanyl-D-alanine carboxypeptidase/D-alanyl-D-alanine-endopeptidase (penicillin-binding protein 4)
MWDDAASSFMPARNSLPFENNTVEITVSALDNGTDSYTFTAVPSCPSLFVHVDVSPGAKPGLRVTREVQADTFTINGAIQAGHSRRVEGAMWDSPAYALAALRGALIRLGAADSGCVTLRRPPVLPLTRIGDVTHPLSEVLAEMNKKSNNLCAESVLQALSDNTSSETWDSERSLEMLNKQLLRLGVREVDIHLVDGSGISFYNLCTVSAVGTVLRSMYASGHRDRFLASLAVSGEDGTLKRRMDGKATRGRFLGKTGTLSGVSTLAGYAQSPGGEVLSVVIFMQNFTGNAGPYRRIQDGIVGRCIEYSARSRITQPR